MHRYRPLWFSPFIFQTIWEISRIVWQWAFYGPLLIQPFNPVNTIFGIAATLLYVPAAAIMIKRNQTVWPTLPGFLTIAYSVFALFQTAGRPRMLQELVSEHARDIFVIAVTTSLVSIWVDRLAHHEQPH